MRDTGRQRNIVIALNIGGKAGREYLQGIFRYINEGHRWKFHLLHHSDELTVPVISRELENAADAFLVGFAKAGEPIELLLRQPKPVVFVDYPGMHVPSRRKDIVFVRSDDEALGLLAAHYLHRCGNFRSYGFLPDAESPRWSILRERGFRKFLMKKGIVPDIYTPRGNSGDNLESWGRALEKPAAVFAVSDNHAVDFTAACQHAHIDIPGQLILAGTDNDELLCNSSSPALTSFKPDHEGIGYRAAKELDALLSGRRHRQREIAIAPSLFPIERTSTLRGTTAGFLIRKAVNFINDNAHKGIGVEDVVSFLGVSRRLLYLRFEQQLHKSVHEVIVDARMKIAKRLLAEDAYAKTLFAKSGFPSAAAMAAAFRSRLGVTPGEYRRAHAANP